MYRPLGSWVGKARKKQLREQFQKQAAERDKGVSQTAGSGDILATSEQRKSEQENLPISKSTKR
jgi:hypothetical protein